MSRRFKASKYKNAAPKGSKHEAWVRDLTVGSYNSYSSFIKSSAAFTAFNVQPTGSQLGVVALDSEGPSSGNNLSILNAHSDLVTDFDFSPFEDGLLATCSADSTVKIWSLTHDNLDDLSLLSPEVATSSKQRRVETVCFHPTAEFLITYTAQTSLTLWDILHNKEFYHDSESHDDKIMSVSWSKTGQLVATAAKDKQVRIIDPRAKEVAATAASHDNAKDGRILWLGETPFILTSGFDSSQTRQVFIRDSRNFDKPVGSKNFDSSTGILLPMFDSDTNMLFIAGRGDSSIAYFEFAPETDGCLLEGYRYNGEQTKGACIVPKRALRVMDTEVNRVLQLTANSIINIPYFVPRKSYIDFHEDLFPLTRGTSTTGTASSWIEGHNGSIYKISLNPTVAKTISEVGDAGDNKVFKPSLSCRRMEEEADVARTLDSNSLDSLEDGLRKGMPEPLPRKKSVSSCSSSEELVGDVLNRQPQKFFPVPKPRVSSGTTTSTLRTPSQFISRMAADFSHRTNSMDETESPSFSNNGHSSSSPLYNNHHQLDSLSSGPPALLPETNDNMHNLINNNGTEQQTLTSEVDRLNNGSSSHDLIQNGNNHSEETGDKRKLSTSDRRKVFEDKTTTAPPPVLSPSNGTEDNNKTPPRLSVAERLKMYQQNANNSGGEDVNTHHGDSKEISPGPQLQHKPSLDANGDLQRNTQKDGQQASQSQTPPSSLISPPQVATTKETTRDFCPAPIAKPERKFTPPRQEAPPVKEVTTNTTKTASSHKRYDTMLGAISMYRNYKAAPFHKKMHIENLRNISTTCPGESELIQANPVRVAVPLNTPGGKVAIFELSRPGRQPDGVMPALVHGSKVMDFMWDPFDDSRLAVGCDAGKIWIWKIPELGLKEQTNEPEFTIAAHGEKIYFVKFHPLAKDILATGSYDLSIRIWDLSTQEGVFFIPCYDQIQIFSFAWSPCGSLFATAAKDGKIRVYDPRNSPENPLLEGTGPAGVRGGRVCWVMNGKFLVVSGFDRSSERQVFMYSANDLTKVASSSLDVSPAILVPFYDEDSSMLFLTGRGDSTIFTFDVIDVHPYLNQLSSHRCPGAHQGVSFLGKNVLDVRNVEFARAYRLTEVVIEPWSFTVPRVKTEYFQDDLFPPTKVLWEPTMSAEEWINGMNIEPQRASLKPANMKSSKDKKQGAGDFDRKRDNVSNNKESNNPMTKSAPSVFSSPQIFDDADASKKQQERIQEALKAKLSFDTKLEQDSMEGVDEEEWNE